MKKNHYKIIIGIISLLAALYMYPWDEQEGNIQDKSKFYLFKMDSISKASQGLHTVIDSLTSIHVQSVLEAKKTQEKEKQNKSDHEKYILNHILDTNADSILLMSRQISDSIIEIGYIRDTTN